ncbi:AAA family ATPase [Maribacter stanieri]|uniref:AAA family ATPase n=1 Tax=Maribacter stanieri TaxID=440514 RepID=UPI0030DBB812|tara:strand:+ start:4896 stop:6014 length:1119 start_codon:yes stop_codon:yes gene_type:complete
MALNTKPKTYKTLNGIVSKFRDDLKTTDFILLFAHNGIGKTMTSMEFKEKGKRNGSSRDTLYFNAYTEDLFIWDNDLNLDTNRFMTMNKDSNFFNVFNNLGAFEININSHLEKYAAFSPRFDYANWRVSFEKNVKNPKYHPNNNLPQTILKQNIKISRGEENLFKWCFYLALCELVIEDEDGTGDYGWVKYFYIDDPISSLDDNNAIAVATDLISLVRKSMGRIKTVISTHHSLFYNVLWNELRVEKPNRYYLSRTDSDNYLLQKTDDTPYFHHVALLSELETVSKSNKIYSYHFNALRSILEKTASFFGKNDIKFCLEGIKDDVLYNRALNLLSHGKYSIFQPKELSQDNKDLFKKILKDFTTKYEFEILN